MSSADRAWIAFWAGITAYEVTAARCGWPLLSEAVDGYREAHPVLTDLAIVYVAGHLLRRWPPRCDPLTRLGVWARSRLG
ncbi:MAG: hypothetical protein K0U84_09130 [Actinomycetia bacterium]|nr:hypothetical protein [Actinomycetes bacterium]